MNEILFLAHRIPFPPNRGDKIRSWHLLDRLGRMGKVHLGCLADNETDAAHLAALRVAMGSRLGDVCVAVRRKGRVAALAGALRHRKPVSLRLFDSPALRCFVHEKLAPQSPVEAVLAYSGQTAQFLPASLRARLVMDFGDVDSEKFAEYALRGRWPLSWLYRREARLLSAFEREVAASAEAVTFVSEAEAALFRSMTGLANIHALPNGVDSHRFDPDADFPCLRPEQRPPRPTLLFTGQMDYPPNVDAVRWFALHVLPLLPSGHFVIAGRNPAAAVKALAGPQVTITGEVADMRSWLAVADIVVAPLRIARGIQNKVLEAMAMARPVVASPAAFAGIEAEPGHHLVVTDSAEMMASELVGLLADPARSAAIGRAARQHVFDHYRWDRCLDSLDSLLFPEPSERVGVTCLGAAA
ncbi:MAG: TIGR03087 family PEP-CTERM/XrtA system glycosyltransferase [Sphingosinicella sp.]